MREEKGKIMRQREEKRDGHKMKENQQITQKKARKKIYVES